MTPIPILTIPEADPLPLPAPGWMLWFLLMLTFLLHILPMNFVLGGSILGGISEALGRGGGRPHHRTLVAWLGKATPVAVAAAISLGVAPLLFVQVLYGRLFFTSSVLMAWPWLLIVPLLILAYYGAYLRAFKGENLGSAGPVVGWVSVVFFLIIGFTFSNNMSLMLRPDLFRVKYFQGAGGLHLNLGDPTLIPRYLHFVIGALAVAAMVVVVHGIVRRRRDPEYASWSIRYGSIWFVAATVVNMAVGLWWLVALPRETMLRFMGGSTAATVIFILAVILALAVLMHMVLVSQSSRPRVLTLSGVVILCLLLAAMVLTRDQVRRAALETAGFRPVAWVAPQWGPILLFAVLLVAAIGAVIWMVVALARGRGEAG